MQLTNPIRATEMFVQFNRIIALQKANKEKYMQYAQQLEQAEQDLYEGFWGGLILEFLPHKIGPEIAQAKREGAIPMVMPVSIDPVLVAFGSGQQVPEEAKAATYKRFVLPEPTIKSSLDEMTLYQLSKFKEQQ